MRIKEYSQATGLNDSDAFVVETTDGTKYIEKRNMGFLNVGTTLPAANGGTGQTSLQATRNAMGLGNTLNALPIANGGTGTTTAAGIRNAIGLGNSTGTLAVANGGTGVTTEAALALKAWPVGSVYMSTNSTSPASLFGGTWDRITGFVLRAGTDGKEGGADSYTHQHMETFGVDDNVVYAAAAGWLNGKNANFNADSYGVYSVKHFSLSKSAATTSQSRFDYTAKTSVSSIPKYKHLYVWQRTK